MSASELIAIGTVAALVLWLIVTCARDFHHHGIQRLHDAGEDVPWWLSHDTNAPDCNCGADRE